MAVDPNVHSGQIHIEQLEIFARVGVPETERATAQRLTANITLWPARGVHDLNDDIARTVNYSAICDETKKFAAERSDKLIETLAYQLAGHLLKGFRISKVAIELRKFVRPDAQYVAVIVCRSAAGD
jgi:dihydroneopterin aldolase/2-amino-4-hydroxy-6-hydroxymethyldihydropteridine diphosphokinase